MKIVYFLIFLIFILKLDSIVNFIMTMILVDYYYKSITLKLQIVVCLQKIIKTKSEIYYQGVYCVYCIHLLETLRNSIISKLSYVQGCHRFAQVKSDRAAFLVARHTRYTSYPHEKKRKNGEFGDILSVM